MTHQTDDQLRELFAPLAADEPATTEISRLRGAAARPRPGRVPRRAIIAVAALTAALGLALPLLQGAGDPPAGGPQQSILHGAAAIAAERRVPDATDGPLRYAKVLRAFSYPAGRDSRVPTSHEQVTETWVGPKWRGREISRQGVSRRDGREVPDSAVVQARDAAFAYGDGALAELDPTDLPSDRDAIARVLRDGIRLDRWGPYPESRGKETGMPAADQASYVTDSFITLLVYARLTADQRAALLDVLAADPAGRDLGTLRDSHGREGRAVEFAYDDARRTRFRVIFDARNAEILEWSTRPTAASAGRHAPTTPDRTETVLATGYTDRVGERP